MSLRSRNSARLLWTKLLSKT
jgi:hypothetical protein